MDGWWCIYLYLEGSDLNGVWAWFCRGRGLCIEAELKLVPHQLAASGLSNETRPLRTTLLLPSYTRGPCQHESFSNVNMIWLIRVISSHTKKGKICSLTQYAFRQYMIIHNNTSKGTLLILFLFKEMILYLYKKDQQFCLWWGCISVHFGAYKVGVRWYFLFSRVLFWTTIQNTWYTQESRGLLLIKPHLTNNKAPGVWIQVTS